MDGSASERIVLICEECGERTVLRGSLPAWISESSSYGCECGERLTLADHLDLHKLAFGISKP